MVSKISIKTLFCTGCSRECFQNPGQLLGTLETATDDEDLSLPFVRSAHAQPADQIAKRDAIISAPCSKDSLFSLLFVNPSILIRKNLFPALLSQYPLL